MTARIIATVVICLVLLPPYIYIIAKMIGAGLMAGYHSYLKHYHCKKEYPRGRQDQ